MNGERNPGAGRRKFLQESAALGGAAALAGIMPSIALAQGAGKIKIGLMLPYTGTYAQLGVAITNGFKLAVQEAGGKLGGREVEYATVDDESEPAKAADNANKIVNRDKVDVLVGTVHSGVQMGMVKIARETGILHIIPNAGLGAATTQLCAPNIFRTSFANAQTTYPMGQVMAKKGHKTAVSITWRYAAGEEMVAGFKDSFTKGGGKVVKELWLPFPNVEFQALLTEIASLKPDAVFAFFAGGGAAKFLKDYQAAGLKGKIPLYGSGFLTDGILEAVGNAADGVETTLHYGDGIDTARDKAFRLAYAKTYKLNPDVYAVQGYDAGLLLAAGLKAVKGDIGKKKEIIAAMEKAQIDSPRGKWTMSKGHNPVQDFYLRKVVGQENKVVSVAMKALDYPPAALCKMSR
ncbi:MAG: ABC transporter substrate-binding protein [Betaproteobacteria bacterium]|nr:ABC transporter substrate-binding protein [Betaproteobacteria bacterium]